MVSRRCTSSLTWCCSTLSELIWALVLLLLTVHSICQGTKVYSASDDKKYQKVSRREIIIPSDQPLTDEHFISSAQGGNARNSCYPMINIDMEKKMFHSPGYPAVTYPNNLDCTIVLTAPAGHLVTLDFRDWFDIEDSTDCKNDYLEVRDGPFGFNKQLENRRFCGNEFPPMMTSSDRHLWIHFHSDENIECKGFKAVFDFVKRPPSLQTPEVKPCHIKKDNMEEGLLSSSEISKEIINFDRQYGMPIDCLWIIEVKKNWKVHLQFEEFKLEAPNNCEENFIQIFHDKTDMNSREKTFCGSMADPVMSKNNVMILRFYNELPTDKTMFDANFTAFRENAKNSPSYIPKCAADEFDCDDETCISRTLKCNNLFNCRFRWDEDDCPGSAEKRKNNEQITIIMVVFSLILAGMCFTFIYNCGRKLVRDHRTIQEYIRQSREQLELDKQEQMEKMSKAGSRGPRSSSGSPSIDRFDMANVGATTPCYVPGGELLPILIRHSEHSLSPPNGDPNGQGIYTVDTEILPEMCDSACQTRESLFTTQGYSSGNSTPSHSMRTNSPPAPFSTFGYKKENNKFKAEATIEMSHNPINKYEEKMKRPYSVQTTKSAPDVIVTH
ncbi:neuropilin and tolloid-like protein 1 isoform X1 [Harmonia axyridis]|uniref:neuropilin and tolloid-like protein 1 isoform X1 n=2 Tax=Harmonia axyridis TaxID=115357 RepID=UPI001E2794D9|nr:neuropilin and tolloid-like protein 1 isoform X1 [Harmonia axyridis]